MQIIFEYNHNQIVFRDALYLSDDHTYTDAEIDAMKQERINNWLSLITIPLNPPTNEDGE